MACGFDMSHIREELHSIQQFYGTEVIDYKLINDLFERKMLAEAEANPISALRVEAFSNLRGYLVNQKLEREAAFRKKIFAIQSQIGKVPDDAREEVAASIDAIAKLILQYDVNEAKGSTKYDGFGSYEEYKMVKAYVGEILFKVCSAAPKGGHSDEAVAEMEKTLLEEIKKLDSRSEGSSKEEE